MDIDMNVVRGLSTVAALTAFVGVWIWAWSKRRNTAFTEVSNQLFDKEEERIHQLSIDEMNHEGVAK
jgi:cytochrome c oxidase cbb3-type subunit 4